MLYEEFNQYKEVKNQINPLCHYYEDDLGNSFFIEPGFYMGLMGYKDKMFENYPLILEKIKKVVKDNHRVIFTADYLNPFVDAEGYIYLELEDITNALGCTWVDDSRPSDYGD